MATEDIRERLAQLPHHAVVAFAARCARRVQPLTHVLPQQGRDVIDRALASAEAFAKGAAAARADDARADAAWSPPGPTPEPTPPTSPPPGPPGPPTPTPPPPGPPTPPTGPPPGPPLRATSIGSALRIRAAPDALGAPIDPSEAGPLGPLWPQGVPEWYTEAATATGTPHDEPSGDAD